MFNKNNKKFFWDIYVNFFVVLSINLFYNQPYCSADYIFEDS